jgi:adenosylmethionine-8-amino-7-oxononanoate aminotransferase
MSNKYLPGVRLTERDGQYLWHPYTSIKQQPIAIKKGKGALLWDENNKEYIDAIVVVG